MLYRKIRVAIIKDPGNQIWLLIVLEAGGNTGKEVEG
jgi:hypothetical protein